MSGDVTQDARSEARRNGHVLFQSSTWNGKWMRRNAHFRRQYAVTGSACALGLLDDQVICKLEANDGLGGNLNVAIAGEPRNSGARATTNQPTNHKSCSA